MTAFLLVTTMAFAQNGGQAPETGSVKITYSGTVNGSPTVKIENKQNCAADVAVSYLAVSTQVVVPANGSYNYVVPTGTYKFKAKNLSNCNSPDYGWAELNVAITSLPVKIGTLRITKKN